MADMLTVKVQGGRELDEAFKDVTRRLQRRWVRGAAAEAANRIRDQAIANAKSVGLAVAGVYPSSPSGRRRDHRGLIPVSIQAWVEGASSSGGGKKAVAGIRVKSGRRGKRQTYHWRWVELGSRHNPVTRPFFFRALREAQTAATAAAADVIRRQINDANNRTAGR